MTPLERIIRRRIAQLGPVTLAEYMSLCVAHPEHGYYRNRDPLGVRGDFTTAPEISQIFGELIGLWIAEVWAGAGRPDPFTLAELGPGRGTLMADALRAAALAPGFREAARLRLVETSPALRARQAETLAAHAPEWFDSVEDLPPGPLLLVANEFFDALPVRQIVRVGGLWRERVVALDGDRLAFALGAPVPHDPAPEGAVREFSPASAAVMEEISARIARDGGAALVIDYGYAAAPESGGDTFQAVRGHAYADPLAEPGEADLTAHVDFAALAAAAARPGLRVAPLAAQGEFLLRLGAARRAKALARANPGEAETIETALRRLTGPAGMGTLFKVLAVAPAGAPPLPGLEAAHDA